MPEENNDKTDPIINEDQDYTPPKKPVSFISGKKTLNTMLQERADIRKADLISNLKILLVCAGLILLVIYIIFSF